MDCKVEASTPNHETNLLRVSGEVDIYTVPKFNVAYAELEYRWRLVVDISKVRYIDETGLGALIKALKKQREKGGVTVLVSPAPQIRKIFSITGLDKIFGIYDTEAEALEAA